MVRGVVPVVILLARDASKTRMRDFILGLRQPALIVWLLSSSRVRGLVMMPATLNLHVSFARAQCQKWICIYRDTVACD
ncbi:uncharacterized protein EI90DRAFT_3096619 [Cantharellus anzutake]|uniref:uncharacterized protein n=1 Tax=Cantharellus anzutake TaxID=1750568 RepID=UPI0019085C33|nr:uncharacterized protein EI90DRAFT_3096619 [Cantharellus anzutake]KAF8311424.1 hypothetical protein EI90DRAFT_3096619 [Cantharellus anzutake]